MFDIASFGPHAVFYRRMLSSFAPLVAEVCTCRLFRYLLRLARIFLLRLLEELRERCEGFMSTCKIALPTQLLCLNGWTQGVRSCWTSWMALCLQNWPIPATIQDSSCSCNGLSALRPTMRFHYLVFEQFRSSDLIDCDFDSIGVVWDSGLGYRSAKGIFTTTCIPAARALMMYYAHNDDSLPPLAAATVRPRSFSGGLRVDDGFLQTDHDKCGLFERHVVRAFMRGSLQLNCFPLGDPDVDLSLPFASTFYIKYFDQTAESFPNVTGRQVVYIPEAETYQGWDFLVHTPGTGDVAERLCFIQVMIQTPRDHDKSHFKIKKSFESSSPDRTRIALSPRLLLSSS